MGPETRADGYGRANRKGRARVLLAGRKARGAQLSSRAGPRMEQPEPKRRVSLATKILIGLVLGAAAGLACNLLFPAPALDALGDMVRAGLLTRGQADALAGVIAAAAPLADPLAALGDMVRTGFITQVQSDAVGALISGREAHGRLIWFADRVMNPIGQVFLRMLFMVVVPLVFASLALGVATVGDLRSVGRIGGRTLLWFLVSTALAACIGLTLVNWFQPGVGMDPVLAEQLRVQFQQQAASRIDQAAAGTGFTIDTFVNIVPKNLLKAAADDRETLGVIFFALMVGIACTQLGRAKVATFLDVLQGLYDVCVKILGYAMRLAPIGVFGLIFATSAKLGLPLLQMLGGFVLVALGGLLFHLFVVLGVAARVLIGINPISLFGRARGLLITAFSTSSSNATLPTNMRTATETFGVPTSVSGFVLPLGATMNMNGTALFEGVAVLFLAQVAGVELSLGQQGLVVMLAVLTAIGTAGVPGGSLPLLAVVLSQVGVPPEMLGLIIGVDRLVDMTRTVPNVMSDLLCAMWVAKKEGAVLKLE